MVTVLRGRGVNIAAMPMLRVEYKISLMARLVDDRLGAHQVGAVPHIVCVHECFKNGQIAGAAPGMVHRVAVTVLFGVAVQDQFHVLCVRLEEGRSMFATRVLTCFGPYPTNSQILSLGPNCIGVC